MKYVIGLVGAIGAVRLFLYYKEDGVFDPLSGAMVAGAGLYFVMK